MAKQVSLTRKHKMAMTDLYNGGKHITLVDKPTMDELVVNGFVERSNRNGFVLTKEGVAKAEDLLAKAPAETV